MEAVEGKAELNCSSMGLIQKKQGMYVNSYILFALDSGDVCNDGAQVWQQVAWRSGNQLYTPFAGRDFCQWGSAKVKDSSTLVGQFGLIYPGHCHMQAGEYTQQLSVTDTNELKSLTRGDHR